MKNIIGIALILASFVIFGVRISKKVQFKQNVSGYLKRAADANTIALANDELTKVIDYLEANNITSGYTSMLWETPNEDIGFWYKNLKASQLELQNLKSNSALERTNVLINLRETLLDTGERTRVTVPKGLAVYPKNGLWGILILTALLSLIVGFIIIAIEAEKRGKKKKEAALKS
ncbi:hypothetical protein SAMN04487910_3106 [Aquimarina amphilecti]|uniref:Four helix bundle sensory module for signal transduction n=1 Tax=Aquimarina amphilecti TaxID=1038014 RepID=A0A1H7SC35_AQUAM|nr:hypothetical protein [Aquimarina amphilecti]SEL70202.1 hypothetical protein SAMN04487910_3106 [Aquimarina amphilecti]